MTSPPPSALSQAALVRRRELVHQRQKDGLARVDSLVRQQGEVSAALKAELLEMQKKGAVLDEIEARQAERGLLAALGRQLARRRTLLERRSITEGLIGQYQQVGLKLRRASAFADELRLCAVELQAQVEELHEQQATATREEGRLAEQVEVLRRALGPAGDAAALPPAALDPQLDRMRFELQDLRVQQELRQAEGRLAESHLQPARQLRDTVQGLHQDMARFVLAATATVDSAGRRIQALGMAADAPVVVSELHQSLEELRQAMDATEAYVEQSQALLTQVLPELSRRLETHHAIDGEVLRQTLEELSQQRARALEEQALREAAEAEVAALESPAPDRTL